MSDCLSDWKFLNFFVKYQKGQITFTMAHGNGTKSSESRKQKTKRKDGKELGKSLLKRKKHDLYTSTRHTTDFEQNQGISSMTEQTSIDEFLARYVFEFWKLYLISDDVPTSLRLWFFLPFKHCQKSTSSCQRCLWICQRWLWMTPTYVTKYPLWYLLFNS